MADLRPYQAEVIAEIERSNAKRLMVVAPTGSGKTVIAASLVRSCGGRVLYLAHRRELILQAVSKLVESGIEPGTILAGEEADDTATVQVASVQTLWRRAVVLQSAPLPPADLLIIDEAHHCRALTYRRLMDAYPEAKVIGLTATPCRGDGRGLGNIFEAMIECPQVQGLIDLGFLVPARVYAPTIPDLRGVHVRLGDYVEKELAARVDQPKLVGDIVTHWHRLAQGRRTVVFATSVEHSIHIRDEFHKSGVKAEHIDGSTPKDERDGILALLERGDIDLITNCQVLIEGWDMPAVSCCVLARPTRHMGLYRQMIGRVLRPAEGKPFALVLDHAGAVFQHGLVEDPVKWTLEVDETAAAPAHAARGRGRRLLACPECSAVMMARRPCPSCGYEPKPVVNHGNGRLTRFDGNSGQADQYEFLAQLAYIAQERGYKPGWAAHKFKERYGRWPPRVSIIPKRPSAEVRDWERESRIAYVRSMQKASGL